MRSMKMAMLPFMASAALMIVMASCSSTKNTLISDAVAPEKRMTVSFLAGVGAGGLVENNKMTGIHSASDMDAITSATRSTFNAGVHREIRFKGLMFETGLDYLAFDQTILYEMPSFSVHGKRDVRFYQLRLPLTYNFQLFKNSRGYARFSLKAGFSLGCTVSRSVADTGTIPAYTFTDWDYGPTLGFAFYPFPPTRNYRIGIYLDLYRGSRIYNDKFHTAEGMGGQSYMKFGIIIHPQL